MENKKNPLSGIITVDNNTKINFYLDGYTVTFLNTDFSEIELDGQFVFGHTYGFNNIAIYKGNNTISLNGSIKLNTGAYIVAVDNALSTDWNTFDSLEFRGGILNSLFVCNALKRESKDDDDIHFRQQNDSLRWTITIDECECELVVGSRINEKNGLEGTSLSNNTACMVLKFSKPQPLESAFKYIQKAKEALGFMIFRKNVGFEDIYLVHNDKYISRMQVFIREEQPVTSKQFRNCITFHDLDTSVAALFSVVFNSKDGQPSYELGFLPSFDNDAGMISNEKIRLICSSLECELSFIDDLYPEEEQSLKKLIKDTKDAIKAHRKTTERLSDKTYDLIFSSIENWTMSASDKVWGIYQRYKDELNLVNRTDISIDEASIRKFIKYRNKITHGTYQIIDQEVATTAYILQGLVYCCILTRFGIDKHRLKMLCNNKMFLC